jgi:stearoyl-CoA desaturase (delta-9 desaturase)
MWILITFLVCHWFFSLFCQTFFLHRYAAHRMFTMSPFWEKFFYVMTFITQGSSCLDPRSYGIMHRMHHAYSDTERDPHSPYYTGNVIAMMLQMVTIYHRLRRGKLVPEERFSAGVPEWKAFDNFVDLWSVRLLWGVLYTCVYFHFMPNLWWMLLLPVHYLMGPIHGSIVNWCGHKYGYRNFQTEDRSKNTFVWDFLMMGELFQNNHHQNPNRLNFAWRWFEFDPTYPIIKVLGWSRVIRARAAQAADDLQSVFAGVMETRSTDVRETV